MRKTVLIQNKRAGGRLFELGSTVVKQEQIPIMSTYSPHPDAPIYHDGALGYADDMKLDVQTGELSFELHFQPGYGWTPELDALYDVTIYCDEVEAYGDPHKNQQVITRCTVRALVLVPKAAMPKPS